jgi:hypothetical protein
LGNAIAKASATMARIENKPAKPSPTSHNKARNAQCMGPVDGEDSVFEEDILGGG